MSASVDPDRKINMSIEKQESDKLNENSKRIGGTADMLMYVDGKIDRWKMQIDSDLRQQSANIKATAIKYSIFGFIVLLVTGITGAWTVYSKATAKVEQTLQSRLDHEFSNENVKQLVATAAQKFTETRASSLISEKIEKGLVSSQRELDRMSDNIKSKINVFEGTIDGRLAIVAMEQEKVSKLADLQRTELEGTAKIYRLANDTFGGSYHSYIKLVSLRVPPDSLQLALINVTALQIHAMLREYLSPIAPNPNLMLPVTYGVKSIDARALEIENLIDLLSQPNLGQNLRLLYAGILNEKSDLDLIDPAIKAFQSNDSLFPLAVFFGHFSVKAKFNNTNFQDREKIITLLKTWKLVNAKP